VHARNIGLRAALAILLAPLAACDGVAHARRADPATLDQVLAAARAGETIVLAPGQYGEVEFPKRAYSQPITLDASQARFT
jgi:hypothetical protein